MAGMDTTGTRTGNATSAALLSIRAAARASGKSERSLRRWIAEGRLSAVDTRDGKRIDAAELLRLGLLRQAPEPAAPGTGNRGVAMLAEVERLTVRVAELERETDRLQADNSRLLGLAEQAQQNLADTLKALSAGGRPAPAATTPPAPAPDPPRSWLRRLWPW